MAQLSTAIDTVDYRGKRVVLTNKKWHEKVSFHPELGNKTFLRNVASTITSPEEVWEDYDDKEHRRCYYRKYSVNKYVKVVVWYKSNPACVVSAYEINYVKETKYPGLRRLV